MSITELRKYRLVLDPFEEGFVFNSNSNGIALFDLFSAFLGAYFLEVLFKLPEKLRITRKMYYLLVIPVGIVVHLLSFQKTYLNQKLFNSKSGLVYKILLVVLFIAIMTQL